MGTNACMLKRYLILKTNMKYSNKMRRFLLFIIFLLAILEVNGQLLNIDQHEVFSDTAKYVTGSVAFKFHLDNKNASVDQKNSFIRLENKNDIVFVGYKNNYLLSSQIKYFNSSGGTFISSGYAHARANYLKMRNTSYESFTQIQYDRNRYLDYRFLFGGGLRWRIISKDKIGLFTGAELMYEHEKWDNPENENLFIIKNLPKIGAYMNFRIKTSETSKFRSLVIYQTGYDPDPGLMRNRISFDLQFEIEIFKKLYFTLTYNGAYEDEPIYPINKFIYTLENGLVWRF